MKPNLRHFRMVNIYCEDWQERQEAFEILDELGVRIPEALRRSTGCTHFPQSTHLLHVQLDKKSLDFFPWPYICTAMVSCGARIYTVPELERIAECGFRKAPRYPIFHIPHDGCKFPEEMMADISIPWEEFMAYHNAMRDQDACMMVPRPYRGHDMMQTFPISRLLCDVERFIGPEEIMEQYGMGFCYEKAFDGRVIKRVSQGGYARARRYYDQHHLALNQLCERHPYMIFFDIHTYTDAIIPPFARKPGVTTPDLCIGTDPRFTPAWLRDSVRNRYKQEGFTTAENEPYSGMYIPEAVLYGRSRCDFIGIMLEFNRRAYCSPDGRTDICRIDVIRQVMRQILADAVLYV